MKIDDVITFDILVTSDIHGHIHPTNYHAHEEQHIGLAKLATLINRERETSTNCMLVDNGDLIQGTPLTHYHVHHCREQIHPAIAALNELKYDAAVLGNHEFNYGFDWLSKVVHDSNFPWLSAGIVDKETNQPVFGKPYQVKWIDNQIKVVLLGVTTHYIPHWEKAEHIKGLEFKDALETVKMWVARIREEEVPDLLIVSYHGGFERDLAGGEAIERQTGENQAYAMCSEVDGIDVLITGHQHRFIASSMNNTTIIQPGCNGQALGKVRVQFEQENDTWTITQKTAELLIPDENTLADESILRLTQSIEIETQDWLNQTIGSVVGDMLVKSPLACRLQDHPFIEFINKVQMDASGAAISTTALLNNESKGFHSTITRRDVLSNFMYPNTLTVLRLSGRDIREALEQTASYFYVDMNGNIAVNPAYETPKSQHYNYDMWEGIEYELNVSKPIGKRVVKLNRNGHPLQDDITYDVVMNDYRAGGGGDYDMYKGKEIVKVINLDLSEVVTDYIIQQGTIHAICDHNWRVRC